MSDTRFAIAQFSGSKDGTMTGTDTITAAWIDVPDDCNEAAMEALWDGTPSGTISCDKQVGVFPKAMGLTIADQPDGTSYAGDLDASTTDLEGEALGSSVVNITGHNMNRIRPKYINQAGGGVLNVRFVFKKKV